MTPGELSHCGTIGSHLGLMRGALTLVIYGIVEAVEWYFSRIFIFYSIYFIISSKANLGLFVKQWQCHGRKSMFKLLINGCFYFYY